MIIYVQTKNGFGVYTVSFNDVDTYGIISISKYLNEMLIFVKRSSKID